MKRRARVPCIPTLIASHLFLLLLDAIIFLLHFFKKGVDIEGALKALRQAHLGEEAVTVYEVFRSHAAIARKNRLLLTLLDDIRQANEEARHPTPQSL